MVNFCSPKSALRTEMTNGILYLSSCMKSSLFVAFMIKFRQDFTEYKSSKKPMKTLHFSPLVLFLLHYEFIFTPMRVPWNGIHVRIREGHRTSGYSFVKLWRTKFMLLLRRNSDTIKALCCRVNCGIAISKCTGYYTRKCVSAQTTRKHKFHGNSMELSWE